MDLSFIPDKGKMALAFKKFAWGESELGDHRHWPLSLKLYTSQILNQEIPQMLIWGKHFIQIHNDPFINVLPFPVQEKNSIGVEGPQYWGPIWSLYEGFIKKALQDGNSYYNPQMEVQEFRKGRKKRSTYWDFSIIPLLDDQGFRKGVLINSLEITDKVLNLISLKEWEEKVNLVMDSAELGLFESNFLTGRLYHSPQATKILGYEKPLPFEEFETYVHPDDKEIRLKVISEARKTGKFAYTIRFTFKEKMKWLNIRGLMFFQEDIKPYRILGVVQDFTNRKNQEEEIQASNKKLKIALDEQELLQKQKDEFLQIASHELRSPLTSIKGYGQLVEEILIEKGLNQEVQMLDKLNDRVDHLLSLVNTLFDVSKINTGNLELKFSEFDLMEVLKSALLDMRLSGSKNPVSQNLVPKALVRADRNRIIQVFHNLLNNAQKYSKPGKEIRVSAFIMEGIIQVAIEDQGSGIPQEDLEKIFTKFYRSRKNPMLAGGLGLGLHLSYQIIMAHGGKIWAESKPGQGSTFYFNLPHL